ncbi:MAG: hypothetical protein MUE30_15850 [Spirosomaceae bacterium]|jgi:predicted nuclease of restriction endonuclease-like RecB superfamily|nr:hypothetical protein [Spirosomataceae bacterium]
MILNIESKETKEWAREVVHRLISSKKQIEKDMLEDLKKPEFLDEVEKLRKRNAERGTPIVRTEV